MTKAELETLLEKTEADMRKQCDEMYAKLGASLARAFARSQFDTVTWPESPKVPEPDAVKDKT